MSLQQFGDEDEAVMSTSPTSGGGEPPAAAVVAAPPPSVGLHGAVAMFDPSQDDWCEYIE
ncbi:hypothetical protein GBAR_LOCUS17861, partial [Geodia barretti]